MPLYFSQENATQKLSWAHSTAGLRVWASVHCQVGQRPKGEHRTAVEVKGELSEPHGRLGLGVGAQVLWAHQERSPWLLLLAGVRQHSLGT